MEYQNIFIQDIIPEKYTDMFVLSDDIFRLKTDISEELKSKVVTATIDNAFRYYERNNIWIFNHVETTGIFISPYFYMQPKRS